MVAAASPTAADLTDAGRTTAGPTVVPAAHSAPAAPAPVQWIPAVEPVTPDPEVVDASELVKAVQLAEQEIARLVAQAQAAEEAARAAAEAAAAKERAAAEKQARQAKQAAQEEKQAAQAAATGAPDCGVSTSGLGAVKSHVRDAAEFLGCLFGQPSMHGVAGRAGTSDHPSGKALDFMVDRGTGDALAACALRNKAALGITYVIWRQRINHGNGWESMEDRGGATANHFDHVHISFASGAGGGAPRRC